MKIIGKLRFFWLCIFMQRLEWRGGAVFWYRSQYPHVICWLWSNIHFLCLSPWSNRVCKVVRCPEESWIWSSLFTHCCCPLFCRCPRADNIFTCAVAVDAHEEQSAAEACQAVGGETVIGRCGRGLDSWGVFKQNRSLSEKPINKNWNISYRCCFL